MDFARGFWKAFPSRPVAALGALYWHVTGKRVRARNRLRMSLAESPHAYQIWIETIEHQKQTIAEAPAAMADWHDRPLITVLLHQPLDWSERDESQLMDMLGSQIYQEWELIVIPRPSAAPIKIAVSARVRIADIATEIGAEALQIASRLAMGRFLLPLPKGGKLPPTCLYHYAEALQQRPEATLLFGDNDWLNADGKRQRPWFKPQWNEELALSQDYVSQAMVVSAAAARLAIERDLAGNSMASYALALAVAWDAPETVVHIPHIQSHHRSDTASAEAAEAPAIVAAHLADHSQTVARISASSYGTVRVDWPLPADRPLVSIIIPTRDKVNLLRACISSLMTSTSYRPFEVIIVDNGSQERAAVGYLQEIATDPAIRVIRDDRAYNFSQLNNLAVTAARGSYLCLLNNDTEILDGSWLESMMRQAVRPHVGAVGARLLYDDMTIQHAGVTIGIGQAAGHAHRFLPSDEAGYFARTHASHYVSAVTAACLLVSKDKFLAVDGLEEETFAIAFNDVDFCLKLKSRGWQNVYVPQATLLHHESKSRGKDTSPSHIERYSRELSALQSKWKTIDVIDPLHHVNLDRGTERYSIAL